MGLYFVDSLVDQFGGDVRVEDNEPAGAVFEVELQKATDDAPQ
jgi:signal transduction histidine kinase